MAVPSRGYPILIYDTFSPMELLLPPRCICRVIPSDNNGDQVSIIKLPLRRQYP